MDLKATWKMLVKTKLRSALISLGLYVPHVRYPRDLICSRPVADIEPSGMWEETDRGGWRSFGGVLFQRKWTDIWTIEVFLIETKPSVIFELGTGTAAFSAYLATYCMMNGVEFHTFDWHRKKGVLPKYRNPGALKAVLRLGGKYHQWDIFDTRTVEFVHSRVLRHERAFIYCDGGSKIRELEIYLDILRPGDFIAVHDYNSEIHPDDVKPYLDAGRCRMWNESLFESTNSSNRVMEVLSSENLSL